MRVNLFTLRYSPTLGRLDDTPLQDFLRDKTLLACREHFFRVDGMPHLLCIVAWQEAPVVLASPAPVRHGTPDTGKKDGRPDPLEGLTEDERVLFGTLRTWRSERARKEGVPPYVILTNKELRAVVTQRPDSLNALGSIEGLGKAKIERHGKEILARLHGHGEAEESAS